MTARDALFRDPPPEGFSRRILLAGPGLELVLAPGSLPDAIVVVEEGELELECAAGERRRFGPGSMIPVARLPLTHLRSVGPVPLRLVAVSRESLPATDDFSNDLGSYCD